MFGALVTVTVCAIAFGLFMHWVVTTAAEDY